MSCGTLPGCLTERKPLVELRRSKRRQAQGYALFEHAWCLDPRAARICERAHAARRLKCPSLELHALWRRASGGSASFMAFARTAPGPYTAQQAIPWHG